MYVSHRRGSKNRTRTQIYNKVDNFRSISKTFGLDLIVLLKFVLKINRLFMCMSWQRNAIGVARKRRRVYLECPSACSGVCNGQI